MLLVLARMPGLCLSQEDPLNLLHPNISAGDFLRCQSKSTLISCRSVWLGRQTCMRAGDASRSWRQRCRKIKGCSFSVFQQTPSCQIESKSNTIQRKAVPQSYQSIIWCNNGRQVYVGPTSIIHAFIRNRSFHFFCFISPLGGRNPAHLSLIHCAHTQTHNTHREVSGFVHILTCRKPSQSEDVPLLCSPTNENEWMLATGAGWNVVPPSVLGE